MSDRDGSGADFLYPFIESSERDPAPLLLDLARSVEAKNAESTTLAAGTIARYRGQLDEVAMAIAARAKTGGRVLTFGNGGSSTDAANLAALLPQEVAARSLAADTSIVTALGNDVGFDLVFSRQVIAYCEEPDTAVGFSTSGNSANVIGAFVEAKQRGMLTVGFAGYDGGDMGRCDGLDHCFVVHSESIHRIQEAQAALSFALGGAIRHCLAAQG